jgi:NADH-quinone oxidoreductase subunit N
VALLSLVFLAFPGRTDVVEPLMWILAAVTMTVGNLIALRQTNIVRLLAYSSVAQAGFMLAPLAVVGDAGQEALTAVVVYLLIYTAMNLGAFAVVIAVARRTGSGDIDSYRGLFQYSPALAVLMSVFLFALAGIPPLAGWVAKFVVFRALLSAETVSGTVLAVVVAVNSVIALFYYANVARLMWFQDAPEGETTSIPVPFSLSAALGIAVIGTLAFGIFPGLVTHFGDVANLAATALP